MSEAAERVLEQVLVLRAQTGDEAAFVELVARYSPRLRYYLLKMIERGPSVDDVIQEVWLDAWRALHRLESVAAFRSWLYTIARRRGVAYLRRQTRSPEPLVSDVESGPGDDFTAEDAEAVHQALNLLPSAQREVLVLRFLDDLSYAEIASIVDCPEGTVKSRIHMAKQALRAALSRSET